jgi:hypothetical protein
MLMSSILFRNIGPASPRDLPKARAVLGEIDQLKEQLLPLDQTELDADRKRGSLGLYAKPVPGLGIALVEMQVDPYDPTTPLKMMRVALANNEESSEGTFVDNGKTRNYEYVIDLDDQGRPETIVAHKHDKTTRLYQSIYVDVETGGIGYREELR